MRKWRGCGVTKLNDKYFEKEIAEIRSGLREYKDTRKLFNAKIAKLATAVPDKTYPESTYGNSLEQCQMNLKALGIDAGTASEICESKFAGKGTQVGVKRQQEAAAQNAKRGIQHVTVARHASVQEQKVPAWIRSNLIHRSEFEHDIEQPTQPQPELKSATVEDNRPAFLKTRSKYVEMMGEHRIAEVKPIEQVTPPIKSANVNVGDIKGEPHAFVKRIQHKMFSEGEFV